MTRHLRHSKESPQRKLSSTAKQDVRIETEAQGRLRQAGHYYLRSMHCTVANGVLTLRGQVPNYYLKQLVQSLLIDIDGLRAIDNAIEVVSATGISSPPRECSHVECGGGRCRCREDEPMGMQSGQSTSIWIAIGRTCEVART